MVVELWPGDCCGGLCDTVASTAGGVCMCCGPTGWCVHVPWTNWVVCACAVDQLGGVCMCRGPTGWCVHVPWTNWVVCTYVRSPLMQLLPICGIPYFLSPSFITCCIFGTHPHTYTSTCYCITSHHLVVPSDAYKLAEATYSSTLHYRKKADTIRNALAVLQKYRFLFNLPRSIERSISNVRVGEEGDRLGHCRGLYMPQGRGNGVYVRTYMQMGRRGEREGRQVEGVRETGGGGERDRWRG